MSALIAEKRSDSSVKPPAVEDFDCGLGNACDASGADAAVDKWVETMCRENCRVRFHKRCWRVFVSSDVEILCPKNGCGAEISSRGVFMTPDNAERKRELLSSYVAQHFASASTPDRDDEECADGSRDQQCEVIDGDDSQRSGARPRTPTSVSNARPDRDLTKDVTQEMATEAWCDICEMKLNSEVQRQRHNTGKKHCRFLGEQFVAELSAQLKAKKVNFLNVSQFNGKLTSLAKLVGTNIGGLEQLAKQLARQQPKLGLRVSRGDRGIVTVGLSNSTQASSNASTAASVVFSAADAGEAGNRWNSEHGNSDDDHAAESTFTSSTDLATRPGPSLQDEVHFPALGSLDLDPSLKQLQLATSAGLAHTPTVASEGVMSTCDICFDGLQASNRVVLLPCGHNDVCSACVFHLFRSKKRSQWRCHICRQEVKDFSTEREQSLELRRNAKRHQRKAGRI